MGSHRFPPGLDDARWLFTFAFDNNGEHIENLHPTPWALRQLCERLGIPAGYFARCPAVLQDVQANHWLRHPAPSSVLRRRVQGLSDVEANGSPRPLRQLAAARSLRRTARCVERALRPPRQRRADAVSAPTAEQQFQARFQVGWFGLSDESLHLRLVDTTIGRDVWHDDRLMAGIHIANSEVGKRAVTVDALIFRLICQNGLIRLVNGRSLLRRRHVSLDPNGFARTSGRCGGRCDGCGAGFHGAIGVGVARADWRSRSRHQAAGALLEPDRSHSAAGASRIAA